MSKYDPLFLEQLQALWGEGFLSPGGPEEVRMIVEGLDLRDKLLLDIGTGLAGPALVLAADLEAKVVGIDVQEEIIADARERVARAGLTDRITLTLTEPGALPFPDQSFDVVFSKDSLIHVPDKPMIYAEMYRVLRPGGVLAISDWLTGPDNDPNVMAFLQAAPVDLRACTPENLLPIITDAGFSDVSTTDRTAWYAAIVREEQRALQGVLGRKFDRIIGREAVEAWHARREPLRIAADAGALRPTHIRAKRPADRTSVEKT